MPKLNANLTFLFQDVDFLDRFESAARAGFKGVEYLSPFEYPAEELAGKLQTHGLQQVLFNLPVVVIVTVVAVGLVPLIWGF